MIVDFSVNVSENLFDLVFVVDVAVWFCFSMSLTDSCLLIGDHPPMPRFFILFFFLQP